MPTETAAVKIEEAIILQKMIKRDSKKDMNEFLHMLDKLSSKKLKQINKSKQKVSIGEINSTKAIINSLDSLDKKELSVFLVTTKTSEPKAKDNDITMIDGNAYCTTSYIKKAQIFVVFMRDI